VVAITSVHGLATRHIKYNLVDLVSQILGALTPSLLLIAYLQIAQEISLEISVVFGHRLLITI
jgi:hypothetical protein